MQWLNPFASLANALVDLFGQRAQHKADAERREDELEAAVTGKVHEQVQEGNAHAMALDLIGMRTGRRKRDISFYLALVPIIGCFIPGAVEHVEAGFAALEKLPQWYKYGIAGMMISVWGYRSVLQPLLTRRLMCGVFGAQCPPVIPNWRKKDVDNYR